MAGKKKDLVQSLSESETLRRVNACAKDAVAKLEAVNERPLSRRERKQFIKVFEETVLLVLVKHFSIVPDTGSGRKADSRRCR